jgi:hypothetical protein
VQWLCKKIGIKKIETSAYNPKSQPVERVHHTIKTKIAMYVDANQKNWDECLPSCMFAIRATPSETRGYSPFLIIHGLEVKLGIENDLEPDREVATKIQYRMEELATKVRVMRQEVAENLRQAQQARKLRKN